MPIKHIFKKDFGLTVSIHTGTTSDTEFIESYAEFYKSPEFCLSYNRLVDLRNANSSNRSPVALRKIAAITAKLYKESKHTPKTAIIAKRDLSYGLSRMYQAYSDSVPGELVVFRDIDDALAWLRVPASEKALFNT